MGPIKFLKDLLTSWGRSPHEARQGSSGKRLFVLLPLDGKRLPVGMLSQDGDDFVFTYDEEFRQRADLPAISAFPNKSETYRAHFLWPFFDVRVPPVDRPDVADVIKEKKLDPNDVFDLLVNLSRKTVTSPFEFQSKRFSSDTTHKALPT